MRPSLKRYTHGGDDSVEEKWKRNFFYGQVDKTVRTVAVGKKAASKEKDAISLKRKYKKAKKDEKCIDNAFVYGKIKAIPKQICVCFLSFFKNGQLFCANRIN